MGRLHADSPSLQTDTGENMLILNNWTSNLLTPPPSSGPRLFSPEEIAALVLLGLLMPFIIIGNLLVILAVVKFRRLQNTTNYFLVTLAIADICTGLFAPIFIVAEVFKDDINDLVLCLGPYCLLMTVCGASMLSLAAIAYDRYVALTRPLEYIRVMTVRKMVTFTVLAGLYSAAIAWSPLMGLTHADADLDLVCSFHLIRQEALIVLLVFLFLPCYVVMFFCYARIFFIARRHVSDIVAVQTSLQRRMEMNFKTKDTKYAKTLGIVIGFFVVLWLPYQICIIVELVSDVRIHEWLRDYLALLSYCNSGINPWIYAFRNKDFKKAFTDIMDQCCHMCCKCTWEQDDALPKPRSTSASRGGSLVPTASSAVNESLEDFTTQDNPRRASVASTSCISIDLGMSRSASSVFPEGVLSGHISAITVITPSETVINICENAHTVCRHPQDYNIHNNSFLESSNNGFLRVQTGNTPAATYRLFCVESAQRSSQLLS